MPAGVWYTPANIAAVWQDAPEDEELLALTVDCALIQVQDFAPALADGAPIPANYRMAQLMQTRNVWNAAKIDPDGGMGEGDFVIRPFPLDWQVKAQLRPRRAVPVVG